MNQTHIKVFIFKINLVLHRTSVPVERAACHTVTLYFAQTILPSLVQLLSLDSVKNHGSVIAITLDSLRGRDAGMGRKKDA